MDTKMSADVKEEEKEAKIQAIEEDKAIKATFDFFDQNKDGIITTDELKKVLKGLGQDCSAEEIQEFVAAADTDGNGTIDFAEFSRLVRLDMESNREEDELVAAFRVFDHENSGYLSTAELKHALKTLAHEMGDNEIEEMFIEADCNGNGAISYEDFAKMIVPKKNSAKTEAKPPESILSP